MSFREELLEAVLDFEHIRDTKANPYRRHNVLRCGQRQWVRNPDGGRSRRYTVYSCGEKLCFKCHDKARAVVVRAYGQYLPSLAEAAGLRDFHLIKFTLPADRQGRFYKGRPERKRILLELKAGLRTVFGMLTRHPMCAYAIIHGLEDADLHTPSFHVHCGILPVAPVIQGGVRSLCFGEADPAKIGPDADRLWQDICGRILSSSPPAVDHRMCLAKSVGGHLESDLGGLGQAFLSVSGESSDRLARVWRFYRDQRKLLPWGLLAMREKHSWIFGR